ncbi:hypothetical protein D5W64_12170 [Salmonella enterica subsp. enterica serovar Saintpaul]|nr:hypothetical protein [Salmonella enterica subsp. enterica serovar Saintpaul]
MIVNETNIKALADSIHSHHADIFKSSSYILDDFFIAKSQFKEDTAWVLFKGGDKLGSLHNVSDKETLLKNLTFIFSKAIEPTIDNAVEIMLTGYPENELVKAYGNILLTRSSYSAPNIYRKDVVTLNGNIIYSRPHVGSDIDVVELEICLKDLIYSEVMSGNIEIHV